MWPSYKMAATALRRRVVSAAAMATATATTTLWLLAAASCVGGDAFAPRARPHDHRNEIDGEPTELLLLNVLFRHGDRTPDVEEMELYPDDPHINNKFEPFGLKALTNKGKAREYQIGLFLRRHYKGFLNSIYIPNELYVRTTDYDRTKMSALACLAGLYPPEKSQQWHKKLMWQPIPYHTLPYAQDDMLYYYTCPRFLEARLEMLHSSQFQRKIEPYQDLFATVSHYVGRNLTTPEEIFYIDNLFQAEQNYNISVPDWAVPLMDEIKEMTVIEYELQFATNELKKVAGGTMLQKMITDSYNKIKGTLNPEGRKMFLYSGHENNVAALLACSGVFEPHQPRYGSTYILELHKKLHSKTYGFRILYLLDIYDEPEVLKIDGCGEFCPFDKFVELTKHTVTSSLKEDCVLRNS